jgi:hypothetical protein
MGKKKAVTNSDVLEVLERFNERLKDHKQGMVIRVTPNLKTSLLDIEVSKSGSWAMVEMDLTKRECALFLKGMEAGCGL